MLPWIRSQVARIYILTYREMISCQFYLFDTKLIAILRRQYRIILTTLGENIFRIGRSRIFSPNQPSIYTSYSMVLVRDKYRERTY